MKTLARKKMISAICIIEARKKKRERKVTETTSFSERVKIRLCLNIVQYKNQMGYSGKELALILGFSSTVVSKIVRQQFEGITTDALLSYYERLLRAQNKNDEIKEFQKKSKSFEKFRHLKFYY